MSRITEYVGSEGVKSSDANWSRLSKPHAGDLVRWADGKLGRIESVGTGFCDPGEAHVCSGLGSAFLGLLDDGKPYVTISGGPFYMLKVTDLRHTYDLHASPFWNWGDNLPGADMGVEYLMARPVFEYVGDADIYDHRTDNGR